MARGFLGGVVAGCVLSGVGATVAAIVAGPPAAPAVETVVVPKTAAPAVPAGTEPTARSDSPVARAPAAPALDRPASETGDIAAATRADAPQAPRAAAVPQLNTPDAPQAAAVNATADTPILPSPQAALGPAPDVSETPKIDTAPAPAPAVGNTAPDAIASEPVPEPVDPPVNEAAETDVVQRVTPEIPQVSAESAPEGSETAEPTVPDARVAALPQTEPSEPAGISIGRPATSLIDRAPAPDATEREAETPTGPLPDQPLPPIQAFAAPFENPDDKPLMSIVLMDTGADLTSGPVGLAALRSFPYPLTFAVDALSDDAATRAAEYRAQGFEVLATLDLPPGATAADAEVNLSVALSRLPQVVGVLEGTGAGLQENRDASDQISEALLASGHGLVLQSKGLNTAQKLALRDGVPAGLVFRDFDSEAQTPTVIRRFLDQAAFRAGQEGGVIMLGRLRPDTISALLLWGLQDRAQRVALAPVSAALLTLAEAAAE
ncbi:MAG: divergent polysaccharide deacetylase family protein [Pseudomonadota bacterium]